MKSAMTRFARLALMLAATGLGAHVATAQAPQRRSSTVVQTPIEAITSFKLRADPVEPAGFVKASRPAEDKLQYVPINAARPEPEKPIMTFEQIKAKEADLDRVRARHDAIGRRAPPKTLLKPVAYAPKKPLEKKKTACLITCVVNPKPTRN